MKKIIKSFFTIMFIALFLIFLFITISSVKADFTITTNLTTNTVCPSSTILIKDIVRATNAGSFTVTISGSASSFTTTVPYGFWLDSGSEAIIYSYITPSSKVAPGNYFLDLTVSSGGTTRTVRHNIIVENCHYTTLKVEPASQQICACEQKTLTITISNLGNYRENYVLTVEGPASSWVNLSAKEITLEPNKTTTVLAYLTSPCNVAGNYEINFVVKSKSEYSKANAKATANIVSCYDYTISSEKTFYSVCEAEKINVPIKIKNFGTQRNVYKINMQGPNWTNIDLKQINVEKDKEGSFNLILQPPFKTQGNFTVYLEAMSELGKVLKKHEISLEVTKCYDAALKIEENKDKICNALTKTYSVVVKNTGKFKNSYDIYLEAPDWVTINEKHLTLNASEEKILTLDAHPSYNTNPGNYTIKVRAVDVVSKAEASDVLNITTVSVEDCYKPAITTKDETISVAKDNTATALFIVENKGTNEANYTIEISGTGTKFLQINPGAIKLAPGKAETIYLYIAPSIDTIPDEYFVTVSVRLKDTTIVATKTITIKVIEPEAEATTLNETNITTNLTVLTVPEITEVKPKEKPLFSKILSWLFNLFKTKQSNKTTQINITNITNATIINATTEINQAPKLIKNIPDITLKAGEKETIDLALYFSDPENDPLTFVVIKPANISVTINGTKVVMEPKEGFTGTREISFYVSDGHNIVQSNLVKIEVTASQ